MTRDPCVTCGDDVVHTGPPPVRNSAGQSVLAWRAAPHGPALERMRAVLADEGYPLAIRSIATQEADDPALAVLDAWAVVTDIVSFYTERIAQEGFLRTATERDSVRQLARTLGYELRPGLSAEVELAVDVETAAGAPAEIDLPGGMPVQTVPSPGALPQVFETRDPLTARGVWNAVPAADRVPQELAYGTDTIWLDVTTSGVRVDDHVLVVGRERRSVSASQPHGADHEKWDLRRVVAVTVDPEHAVGWTRLTLDEGLGFTPGRTLVAEEDVEVFHLTRRLSLFGWNAPDEGLLDPRFSAQWADWAIVAADRTLEIDGDVAELATGAWLVLAQPGLTEAYRIMSVTPSGAKKFGVSGKVTLAEVDVEHHLDGFDRNRALVHAVTRRLPTASRPQPGLVGAAATGQAGRTLDVVRTDPPLPADRLVLVAGTAADGRPAIEACTVSATRDNGDGTLTLTLDPPLAQRYHPGTVTVRGNAVVATHGETVEQVLGSGDGSRLFQHFDLRRTPLTHVRSTTDASGALPALEVRVDGVAWSRSTSLDDAVHRDPVYVAHQNESGTTTVTFGDGRHGARPTTGAENVTTSYRVGIGADGAAEPGQVRLPVRKPRGLATVSNPLPSRDWAPPERLDEARVNAPQRVRTLDRVVSVADYADFARGYSGIGRARADLVWDGQADTVVVSVLDARGRPASDELVADLRSAIDGHREDRPSRQVLPGAVVDAGASLTVTVDPAHERDVVLAAVRAAVLAAFGSLDFGVPVAASAVLVTAAQVTGVRSATMPVLSATGAPGTVDLVVAEPARWGGPSSPPAATLLAAQALRITDETLDVAVSAP